MKYLVSINHVGLVYNNGTYLSYRGIFNPQVAPG
jgi:hypothetical protein